MHLMWTWTQALTADARCMSARPVVSTTECLFRVRLAFRILERLATLIDIYLISLPLTRLMYSLPRPHATSDDMVSAPVGVQCAFHG
jgi:hypothetical protein